MERRGFAVGGEEKAWEIGRLGEWEVLGTGVKVKLGMEGKTESKVILGWRGRKVRGCIGILRRN